MKKIRVAINGFGRIGRTILRAYLEGNYPHIDIVAINDLGQPATLAHLLQYDSTHGPLPHAITTQDDTLVIGDKQIHCTHERDPAHLPWKAHSIDIVMECTGLFRQPKDAAKHQQAGAKKVLVSAPAGSTMSTVVYGVNHHTLTADDTLVSNASCTTNCLAPMAAVLDTHIGIQRGLMTTIHAYTNDQVLTDSYHSDLRRARSATQSLIPTKTGAASAVGLVLPSLNGKLDGLAVRVPTLNVSLVDLVFEAQHDTTVDAVNAHMKQAAETAPLADILAYNASPLVSIDFNHHPASCIFDATQTKVIDRRTVKVLAWYDNEWGFSNRMLDTATHMGMQS